MKDFLKINIKKFVAEHYSGKRSVPNYGKSKEQRKEEIIASGANAQTVLDHGLEAYLQESLESLLNDITQTNPTDVEHLQDLSQRIAIVQGLYNTFQSRVEMAHAVQRDDSFL